MTVLAPVIYIFIFVVIFFTPTLISQQRKDNSGSATCPVGLEAY